jgi:hypothetical protein
MIHANKFQEIKLWEKYTSHNNNLRKKVLNVSKRSSPSVCRLHFTCSLIFKNDDSEITFIFYYLENCGIQMNTELGHYFVNVQQSLKQTLCEVHVVEHMTNHRE